MPIVDIIGDIHGNVDKLRRLLGRLNYRENGGVYAHPERSAIFVGDLIDRGPAIGETLELVSAMIRSGSAQIIMGNHEFNALAFHTPDGKGGYLRRHTEKNCSQHSATLDYFQKNPNAAERALTWFYSFPLWLDLGFARIVHAAWSASAIQLLQTPYLNHDRLLRGSTKGTPEYDAIDTLLKGVEVRLPAGSTFADKDAYLRAKIRVRWWLRRDPQGTIAETVFPPDPSLPKIPFATATDWEPYGSDQPPVIFGHYWLPKDWPIRPLAPNVICVDFSAGKGGPLVAYSLNPERAEEPQIHKCRLTMAVIGLPLIAMISLAIQFTIAAGLNGTQPPEI